MDLKDESDYEKEDRHDLVSRLMACQALAQFFLKAYDALLHYGVNFKTLPEWKDQRDLDAARKLKPNAAKTVIIGYFGRLESALSAAVRRTQFRLQNGGRVDPPTSH